MSSSSEFADLKRGSLATMYIDAFIELGASKRMNVAMELKIQELTEKMERMSAGKMEEYVEEESILTSIVGSWNIISSDGMEEFLEKLKPSEMGNALFRAGTQTYEYDGDTLMESWALGTWVNSRTKIEIGEETRDCKPIIDNNVLVSVYFREDGEEFARVERFVKDGKLHMVTKRFGLKCTRVYEKAGEEKKRYLEATRRIAQLESELEKLRVEKREDEEQLLDQHQETLDELKREKTKYAELDAEFDDLTEELDELKEKKADVEKKLQERLKGDFEVLESLERQTRISINLMEEAKIQLAENDELKKKLKEVEEMLSFAHEQKKKLRVEKCEEEEQFLVELKEKNENIEELEAQVEELKMEKLKDKEELTKLQQKSAKLEEELMEEIEENMRADRERYGPRFAELDAELDDSTEEFEELKEEKAEVEEENLRLKGDMEVLDDLELALKKRLKRMKEMFGPAYEQLKREADK